MRTTRTLALRRETLSQLTDDDMYAVVGGSHDCPTANCTALTHGPSIDETCPTAPPTGCVRPIVATLALWSNVIC